jgi:acyl-CoA reductase-like NAD-dependent aldehyde dehydrogenase
MNDTLIVESTATPTTPSVPVAEARRASYNPATGALLGYVPLVGTEGIDAAIVAAHAAQPAWGATSPRERASVLHWLQGVLVDEAEAITQLISLEQGKTIPEAYGVELMTVLPQLKWLTARDGGVKYLEGQKVSLEHPMFSVKKGRYVAEPLGVIAIISPWNYPFTIPLIQVLTALMAGNGVVLKPSPHTPLIGQKIAELLRQTDLPAGLFHVIHCEDSIAPHLTSHPGIDKIIFTGSVVTGRKVMASAAQVPTPVVLELGGKDAAIVASDADLKRTVNGVVWYGMTNAGQTCASVERVYVHRDIYDAFVKETVELVQTLKVGEGIDSATQVGPLTNEQQLRIVQEQVEDAKAKGAQVLVGGYPIQGQGYFYAPTVLVNVTPEMRIMQEETFGPVLPIARVNSLEEAVSEANRIPYGLTGSVWTRNEKMGQSIAEQMRAGAVNINDHAYHFGDPAAAWGGVGNSGHGRTHGVYGLMEMVNTKFISSDMRRGVLEPWWYPYNEQSRHFLSNAVRMLYGQSSRRLWAAMTLMLNPRTWRLPLVRIATRLRKLL